MKNTAVTILALIACSALSGAIGITWAESRVGQRPDPLVCEANTQREITQKGDAGRVWELECRTPTGDWEYGHLVIVD